MAADSKGNNGFFKKALSSATARQLHPKRRAVAVLSSSPLTKTFYLLAGRNGAGKPTAAYTLLPGLLETHKVIFQVSGMLNHAPIEKACNVGVIQV